MDNRINKDLLIVKVGTNTLTDTSGEVDRLDTASFRNIGREVSNLSNNKTGIVIVSSGAITAGILKEGKKRRDIHDTAELQRYAARGWRQVLNEWDSAIGDDRISTTLITKQELTTTNTRAQIVGNIACCLSHNDIFVTNENDTICDEEIKYGDNDTLSAELAKECAVSGLFGMTKLVLLTNIDGLLADKKDESTLIRNVSDIDEIAHYAGDSISEYSKGGMKTKIEAARIATEAGVETFVANGRAANRITRALNSEIGTRFIAQS